MSARPAGRATDVLAQRVNGTLRKGILAAARSRRIGGVASKHGMRLGANRFVAGETFDEAAEVLARLNERGLHANTTLLGEDVLSEDGGAGRHGRVRADPRRHRRARPARQHRAQAHAPRAPARRGARVRQRQPPRRPRGGARQLHPPRHGALRPRRPDAGDLPAPARRGPRRGRHRAAVVPLPHSRRPGRAAAAAAQPPAREGRLPRAAGGRLPAQGRRRQRLCAGWSRRASRATATPPSPRTTSA